MQQLIYNSIISDSHSRLSTNKLVWASYSTDQQNFTDHMFNIKLEEKSYKMSLKALAVKIQRSKNRGQLGLSINVAFLLVARKGLVLNTDP